MVGEQPFLKGDRPAGRYTGRWAAQGWVYETTLDCSKMSVDGQGNLTGEVHYLVLQNGWGGDNLKGRSGLEYFKGKWNKQLRTIDGAGTSVTNTSILGISPRYAFRFVDNHVRGIFGDTEVDLFEKVEGGKEMVIKREIMRIKKYVGLVRFLAEDVGQSALQGTFLWEHWEGKVTPDIAFTVASISAGLLVSIGGPLNEWLKERRIQRKMQAAGLPEEEIKVPSRLDEVPSTAKPAPQPKKTTNKIQQSGSSSLAGAVAGLASAATIQLNNHGNVVVPDISVLEVFQQHRFTYYALCFASVAFFVAMGVVPFVFDENMSKANMLFVSSFCCVQAVEVWIAQHTAKGYRFLTGYPGQFFFNVFLSFLTRFDLYSDITFVRLAFDEGSWVAKPSLLLLLVGVVALQVIPAIALLVLRRNIMVALKLNDFNILMQLVFAQTTNEH